MLQTICRIDKKLVESCVGSSSDPDELNKLCVREKVLFTQYAMRNNTENAVRVNNQSRKSTDHPDLELINVIQQVERGVGLDKTLHGR